MKKHLLATERLMQTPLQLSLLADEPEIKTAVIAAIQGYGLGSGGSPASY